MPSNTLATNITKQYITFKSKSKTLKKQTFFSLAKGSCLPKTGISEDVAKNFDTYLYAK